MAGIVNAYAKDPVLEGLVQEAVLNNPEIQALRQSLKAGEERIRIQGSLEDPSFKIELMDVPKDSPFDLTPNNAMLTRYSVTQAIPFPGKRRLRQVVAEKEALRISADVNAKTLEVVYMLKEAYLDYAFTVESLRILNEIRDVLTYMSRIAEARYSLGQATQQDIIKVQLESTMLANEATVLRAGRDLLLERIRAMLGRVDPLTLPEDTALPRERVDLQQERLQALEAIAMENNPAVIAARLDKEAANASQRLSEKTYYPDFMLGVAPVQRDEGVESFDFMLQANIPIWQEKNRGIYNEAASLAAASGAMLVAETNRATLELREAFIKAKSSERIMEVYEKSLLPQSGLGIESALKNYSTGRIDFIMLLDTERQLKRTRIEHLRTILEYSKNMAALERVLGATIEK